jgi:CubicO group peptidase (beta-lactamase class C family)
MARGSQNAVDRLQAAAIAIPRICALSGTPGASVGVLHNKEVIYTEGFGYRDVEAQLPPDEQTIYHIASLSKAVTSAAFGILVEEKKTDWGTPIKTVLPDFYHPDRAIREELNIVDLLSHRAGVATQNALWIQEHGHLKFSKEETLPMFATLPKVREFRSKFGYSNWGYGLAALVLEKLTGVTWGQYLHSRLFQPLGLTRTFTEDPNSNTDNIANPYVPLTDGTIIPQAPPSIADGTVMLGGSGIRSCVSDLLVFYKALLSASKDQFSNNTTSTLGLPFCQVPTLLSSHVHMPGTSLLENTYAMGWVRTQLPQPLGSTGTNGAVMSSMPVVGRGSKSQIVINHSGSLSGFFSAVLLLPETDSAIVVLTNSISKNDCADWISQLLLEALIDSDERNDYVHLANVSAEASDQKMSDIPKHLAAKQILNTSHRPLPEYAGKYYNSNGLWFLEVFIEEDGLRFCMKGDRRYVYKLSHFHYESFSWIMTRDELVRLGRFPNNFPDMYLLEFTISENAIHGLYWHNDRGITERQFFKRADVLVYSGTEIKAQHEEL